MVGLRWRPFPLLLLPFGEGGEVSVPVSRMCARSVMRASQSLCKKPCIGNDLRPFGKRGD